MAEEVEPSADASKIAAINTNKTRMDEDIRARELEMAMAIAVPRKQTVVLISDLALTTSRRL